MAQRTSNSRSKSSSSRSKSTNSRSKSTNGSSAARAARAAAARTARGRSASQKPEKYRFAQNVGGDATMAEQEYRRYATGDGGMNEDPDVLLTVPVVKVDSIHLEVDDLDARVRSRRRCSTS